MRKPYFSYILRIQLPLFENAKRFYSVGIKLQSRWDFRIHWVQTQTALIVLQRRTDRLCGCTKEPHGFPASTQKQEDKFGQQNRLSQTYHIHELQFEVKLFQEASMETQILHSKQASSCLPLALSFSSLHHQVLQISQPNNFYIYKIIHNKITNINMKCCVVLLPLCRNLVVSTYRNEFA